MRFLLVILAACWTGPASAPPEEPAPVAPRTREPCTFDTFDPRDASCEDLCPREAPAGWPACVRLVESYVTAGFTCPGSSPYACTPPSPVPACASQGCPPFEARIIALRVVNHSMEITVAGGAAQGVTMAWSAALLDASGQPIPHAVLSITRVDRASTKISTTFPVSHVQARRVRLAP